jgi:glycosyltransferase involved in cell wall biosynthesis
VFPKLKHRSAGALHVPTDLLDYWITSDRPRVLTMASHTAFPPLSGGHQRGYHVNKSLAENGLSVLYISPVLRREQFLALKSRAFRVADNFVELQLFRPVRQIGNTLLDKLSLPPLAFSLHPNAIWSTPALTRLALAADAILIEHPWLFPRPIPSTLGGKPLVLNAHNIEQDLYAPVLGEIWNRWIRKQLAVTEANAFAQADLAFVCSDEDAERAHALYGVQQEKLVIIPNGAMAPSELAEPTDERSHARARLGLNDRPTILFVGSAHRPNVEGAKRLLSLLHRAPRQDRQYLFIGSVCDHLPKQHVEEVKLLGRVDALADYYAASDLAINPVEHGAGTNVKMLEYMAARLPILTTPVGARGIALRPGIDAVIAPLEEFPARIEELLADFALRNRLRANARALAETLYSWPVVGQRAASALKTLLRRTGPHAPTEVATS